MENDQRLTPLPVTSDLHVATAVEYPLGYSPSYDGVTDNKRSIREYINIVYKRLPIILAITVLVTAAAAFYSYRLPSIYRAGRSPTQAAVTLSLRASSCRQVALWLFPLRLLLQPTRRA